MEVGRRGGSGSGVRRPSSGPNGASTGSGRAGAISCAAMAFPGGSAYALARDIAGGFTTVSERTFKTMTRPDLDLLGFEIDRHLRELRGEQPALDDLAGIQQRNRRL